MPAAASGSSALISPFTPDFPAAIPPSAALFEVYARVTTLNHRFVFLKLFLVVLYFSRRKMSRASWDFLSRINGRLMHGQSVSVSLSLSQSVSVSFSLLQSVEWQADYKTDWNRREARSGKQRLDPGKIDFSQLSSDIHDQLTEISILFWLYRIAISSWNRISVSFYVSALGKWLKRQLLPYLNASSHGFVASIWESFSQLPLIINPKLTEMLLRCSG